MVGVDGAPFVRDGRRTPQCEGWWDRVLGEDGAPDALCVWPAGRFHGGFGKQLAAEIAVLGAGANLLVAGALVVLQTDVLAGLGGGRQPPVVGHRSAQPVAQVFHEDLFLVAHHSRRGGAAVHRIQQLAVQDGSGMVGEEVVRTACFVVSAHFLALVPVHNTLQSETSSFAHRARLFRLSKPVVLFVARRVRRRPVSRPVLLVVYCVFTKPAVGRVLESICVS